MGAGQSGFCGCNERSTHDEYEAVGSKYNDYEQPKKGSPSGRGSDRYEANIAAPLAEVHSDVRSPKGASDEFEARMRANRERAVETSAFYNNADSAGDIHSAQHSVRNSASPGNDFEIGGPPEINHDQVQLTPYSPPIRNNEGSYYPNQIADSNEFGFEPEHAGGLEF